MPQLQRKPVIVDAIKLPQEVSIQCAGFGASATIGGNKGDYLVCAEGRLYICTEEELLKTHEPTIPAKAVE